MDSYTTLNLMAWGFYNLGLERHEWQWTWEACGWPTQTYIQNVNKDASQHWINIWTCNQKLFLPATLVRRLKLVNTGWNLRENPASFLIGCLGWKEIVQRFTFINTERISCNVRFFKNAREFLNMFIFDWRSNEMHTDVLCILYFTMFALHVLSAI
jgi:hypothetical protein